MRIRRVIEPWGRKRPGVTILAFAGADLVSTENAAASGRQIERITQRTRVVTLDEAVRGLTREDHSVDNSVVITVDECSAGFVEVVVPVLVTLHVPATLYVTTEFVEQQRPLISGAAPVSWSVIVDALGTNMITLGSHGHSGQTLERADAATASAEVRQSIDLIEMRTGRTPAHFAYPGGVAGSAEVRQVVREHFHSASVAGGRTNPVGRSDLYRLERPVVTPRTRELELDALIRPVRVPNRRGRRGSAAWSGALDTPRR